MSNDELRKLAEELDENNNNGWRLSEADTIVETSNDEFVAETINKSTAQYIAAASPSVVLGLLHRLGDARCKTVDGHPDFEGMALALEAEANFHAEIHPGPEGKGERESLRRMADSLRLMGKRLGFL